VPKLPDHDELLIPCTIDSVAWWDVEAYSNGGAANGVDWASMARRAWTAFRREKHAESTS